MSKGLEALKFLRRNYCILKRERESACNIIEKELKALEILIRKNINLWIFKNTNSYRAYIEGCHLHEQCSKEEYDLLKEVLL